MLVAKSAAAHAAFICFAVVAVQPREPRFFLMSSVLTWRRGWPQAPFMMGVVLRVGRVNTHSIRVRLTGVENVLKRMLGRGF